MEEINLTSVIEGVYFLGSLYTEGDSFSQKYFASAKRISYDGNGIILHKVLVAFKRNLLKEGTLCVESHNIDQTRYNRRSKVNCNTIDILRINVRISCISPGVYIWKLINAWDFTSSIEMVIFEGILIWGRGLYFRT